MRLKRAVRRRLRCARARGFLRARRRRLPRDRADPRALGPGRPARRSALGAARARDRAAAEAAEFQVGRDHLRDPARGADRAGAGRGARRAARAGGCRWSRPSSATARASADAGARLADPHRRLELPGEALTSAEPPPAPRRAPRPSSSRPGRSSATTRRWSGASSPAASSSRARRRSGCGCASRWSPARSRRRCSGRWSPPTSATGSAPSLDFRRYLFINVDLTVHLERMPEGEWVCVDAVTLPRPQRRSAPPSRCSPTRDGRIGRAAADAAHRRALARRTAQRPASRSRGRRGDREGDHRRRDRGRSRRRAGRRPRSRSARRPSPASGAPSPTPASKKAVKVPSAAPRRLLGDPADDDQRERGVEQREGGAHRQRRRRSRPARLWAKAIVARPTASTSAAAIATRAGADPVGQVAGDQPGEDDHRREGAEDGGAVADAAGVEVEDDEGGDGRVADRGERQRRSPGRTASRRDQRVRARASASRRAEGVAGAGPRSARRAAAATPAKIQTRRVAGGVAAAARRAAGRR